MTDRLQLALDGQYSVALDRRINGGTENSYTTYLYSQGLDKILKKVGEECFEVCIAAKNDLPGDTVGELNDVLYHLTVLLCFSNVTLTAVLEDVNRRCQSQGKTISQLLDVVTGRREESAESSYTAYLFRSGLDKILKKVGEACTLLVIAGKEQDREAISGEAGDLVYHLLVLMAAVGLTGDDLALELEKRSGVVGNLKQFHTTDMTT